jgi:transcriptional regulator with PAS, ATPase and Fis domain
MGKSIESISQKTMDLLIDYSWPGNIRERQNVIERGVVLSKGSILKLGADLLPVEMSHDVTDHEVRMSPKLWPRWKLFSGSISYGC